MSFLSSGAAASGPTAKSDCGVGNFRESKVIGMRRQNRRVAWRRPRNSEVPHFAYIEEIDVTALESLRQPPER